MNTFVHAPALAHASAYGPHMGQMNWGMDGWGGVLALVVAALLLAVVVFAVVRFALLPVVEAPGPGRREDEALTLLRERFARGEIDEEEFDRRAAALDESR